MNPKEFIVVSRPRSGTTYFCNTVLSSHDNIFCYDELFNVTENTKIYLKKIGLEPFDKDISVWKKILMGGDKMVDRYIHNHYNHASKYYNKSVIGFKLFAEHLTASQYSHVLSSGKYSIIFLQRKNLLKTAISYAIAQQTNQWDARDKKDFSIEIEPATIDKYIAKNKQINSQTISFLENSGTPFFLLDYDDLSNIVVINNAIVFLGEKPLSNLPEWVGELNNEERYKMIRNVEQIEKLFACKDNGYLFDS